jgi:hypothetical protein
VEDHLKVRVYRHRAEELRTIAQDFLDEKTQALLAKLADDYERMADALERRAKLHTRTTMKL